MSISRRTVSTHVSSILKKLHMTSRVELAMEVTRRQNPRRCEPKKRPPLPFRRGVRQVAGDSPKSA
ncbi:LuxR C-terminal-related transcriptional regulator [Streptomyces tubercidicus]|uniref:LuxR C-terminal-related transcriptional regulator n=1 Tax=Streptomyces tubercidicus TaxID=47759 RepID=UPI00367C02DD